MRTSSPSFSTAVSSRRGFTYLGVLLAMALLSVGLMAVSEVWVTTAHREKMTQLEWAGLQYQRAITSYYHASPGLVKTYPPTLNELLEDHRFVVPRRHLRVLYLNPITSQMDWEPVVSGNGGVQGVRVVVPWRDGVSWKEFLADVTPVP
jgi:type II secretory pathway pseudopilin PulG